MIKTWYADTSQVQNMDNFRREIQRFLDKACDAEPNDIHQVKFVDDIFNKLRE